MLRNISEERRSPVDVRLHSWQEYHFESMMACRGNRVTVLAFLKSAVVGSESAVVGGDWAIVGGDSAIVGGELAVV